MTSIYGKARPRSEVRRLYQSLWEVIYQHLVLICAWPEHRDVPHWKLEVEAAVERLSRLKLKRSKRGPDRKTLLDWLDEYYPVERRVLRLTIRVLQRQKELPEPRPLVDVQRCVDEKQERIIRFLAREAEDLEI